jgi:CRP/FNR family transcriptional regulator
MVRLEDIKVFEKLPLACSRCAVRSRSLCGALSGEQLKALNDISLHRSYAGGQTIVTEGERDFFGNVVDGIVIEKKSLEDGREQIVSLLFPADFLGRVFTGTAEATVEAVSEVTLCTFDKKRVERVLDTYPELGRKLLEHTVEELGQAREWLLLLGQKTATERVATFLVRLASRSAATGCSHLSVDPKRTGVEFTLPISRGQIAAFLGMTIETVSRKLTALRKAGVIEIVDIRTVRILDAARLNRVAGQFDPDA